MLPFGLATRCQRVTAPDSAGDSSEFSEVWWYLAIVKEPLPSSCRERFHQAHLVRAVLWSEASGALHSGSRFILWHFVAVPQRFTA